MLHSIVVIIDVNIIITIIIIIREECKYAKSFKLEKSVNIYYLQSATFLFATKDVLFESAQ